ncbi:MAG TPA: MFS transporter [Solirubrobacteraceae bacterium]|jgi:EmrB/QacA subfamily drug resistance transporter|nr:MFS transporter [Solirubrobacteraceae bacterium]
MTDARLRNTALLVAGCFFMENLDGTIVTTAAPRIGRALHVPATSVGLVIAAYMVTLAVLIPLSGWMAARWGARSVFLSAIAIFTLSSLACAASTTFPELVVFRVLQGVGGAMMVPVGRLVVLSRTEKSQMLRMVGLLVWPALLAPVIAPLAGGVITTYASWRWLFLVNVPLGVLALAVAWRLIDSPRAEDAPPLDPAGVVLTCGGLAAATYMAYLLSQSSVSWSGVIACAVAAVAALSGATVHLLRTAHPLVNLRTLRVPTFRAALGGGSLFWTAITSVPFLLTLLFQNAFGWSPVKSGAVVLFVFVGNLGIKPATTPMLRRFGYRPVLVAATAGAAATMVAAAFFDAATPLALIAGVAVLNGIGRSVSLTCYSTIAFSDTPPEQIRDANTLQATAQQLAVGLGVPVGAVALRAGGALSRALPGAPTTTSPFTVAFLLLAIVALGGTVGALRLHPDAGAAVTRRPGREPAAATATGDP